MIASGACLHEHEQLAMQVKAQSDSGVGQQVDQFRGLPASFAQWQMLRVQAFWTAVPCPMNICQAPWASRRHC